MKREDLEEKLEQVEKKIELEQENKGYQSRIKQLESENKSIKKKQTKLEKKLKRPFYDSLLVMSGLALIIGITAAKITHHNEDPKIEIVKEAIYTGEKEVMQEYQKEKSEKEDLQKKLKSLKFVCNPLKVELEQRFEELKSCKSNQKNYSEYKNKCEKNLLDKQMVFDQEVKLNIANSNVLEKVSQELITKTKEYETEKAKVSELENEVLSLKNNVESANQSYLEEKRQRESIDHEITRKKDNKADVKVTYQKWDKIGKNMDVYICLYNKIPVHFDRTDVRIWQMNSSNQNPIDVMKNQLVTFDDIPMIPFSLKKNIQGIPSCTRDYISMTQLKEYFTSNKWIELIITGKDQNDNKIQLKVSGYDP